MITATISSLLLFAGVVCEDGLCRLVPDEPESERVESRVDAQTNEVAVGILLKPDRVAQGYMDESAFLAFLSGEDRQPADSDRSFALLLLLAILGGLALNLTPCVLPMIPVNLLVIGASIRRGVLYGLGQMTAFGALGLLASLGGVAFGTIQSSPWFNGAVAVLLVLFALSLLGAFTLDFTRFRTGLRGGAFLLGAVSAILAGACVAPVLATVLVLTAQLTAEGRPTALLLPFAVGLGLALPWPFLGAGLKVLPKPGGWMRWVNRAFALVLLALAVHYALVSAQGFRPSQVGRAGALAGARDLTVEDLRASDLLAKRSARPVLVYCHASWCKNCSAMERLIGDSEKIRAELDGWDVIRLEAEDPNALRRLPGFETIRGLPAFLRYLPVK